MTWFKDEFTHSVRFVISIWPSHFSQDYLLINKKRAQNNVSLYWEIEVKRKRYDIEDILISYLWHASMILQYIPTRRVRKVSSLSMTTHENMRSVHIFQIMNCDWENLRHVGCRMIDQTIVNLILLESVPQPSDSSELHLANRNIHQIRILNLGN